MRFGYTERGGEGVRRKSVGGVAAAGELRMFSWMPQKLFTPLLQCVKQQNTVHLGRPTDRHAKHAAHFSLASADIFIFIKKNKKECIWLRFSNFRHALLASSKHRIRIPSTLKWVNQWMNRRQTKMTKYSFLLVIKLASHKSMQMNSGNFKKQKPFPRGANLFDDR